MRLKEELRAGIRKARADHIFQIFKNDELTEEELTAEVEIVRQQMYEMRMKVRKYYSESKLENY